jgi:hypothetical protein
LKSIFDVNSKNSIKIIPQISIDAAVVWTSETSNLNPDRSIVAFEFNTGKPLFVNKSGEGDNGANHPRTLVIKSL